MKSTPKPVMEPIAPETFAKLQAIREQIDEYKKRFPSWKMKPTNLYRNILSMNARLWNVNILVIIVGIAIATAYEENISRDASRTTIRQRKRCSSLM